MATFNPRIVKSRSTDPFYNLTYEEMLLQTLEENDVVLLLWQNESSVILGRNQNVWRECRLKELEMGTGSIVRRRSGGGAVFHDLGNINFSFITHRKNYNLESQMNIVIKALKLLGIEAIVNERNDILVQKKKVSGNAYYIKGSKNVHHGTLLVDSDLLKLTKSLELTKVNFESKGIQSVLSKVTNLTSVNPNLTVEDVFKVLELVFKETYGEADVEVDDPILYKTLGFDALLDKYKSWDWVFGESPKFEVEFEKLLSIGPIRLKLKVIDGYIKEVDVKSLTLKEDYKKEMMKSLIGQRFDRKDVMDHINSNLNLGQILKEELMIWTEQWWL